MEDEKGDVIEAQCAWTVVHCPPAFSSREVSQESPSVVGR